MAAETAFQAGLYTALTAAGLRVYDFAPQSVDGASTATLPYVEIGFAVFSPFDTRATTGFDIVQRIHVRDKSGSAKATKDILGQIYTALHRKAISVTGYQLVTLERVMSDVTRVTDGSFHGVCEFRALINKL
jgi:hypothetical protein